jgi:hypothetical protein
MLSEILKYTRELRRAMRNHKYERSPQGLYLNESRTYIGGMFGVSVNGSPITWEKNLVVNEGLNHILDVTLHAQAQLSTWYIAPFEGNFTPTATWTAANYNASADEFANYNEAARVEWVEGTVASQSVDNTASKARFTISAGGGTIYGAGMLSTSAKLGTSGKLFAATRFATSRVVLEADLLDLAYTVSMTSS